MNFAAFMGIKMSRPTVIKFCRQAGICKRRTHSTHLVVLAAEFRLEISRIREDY